MVNGEGQKIALEEFNETIRFHENVFIQLEGKAKYWLSVLIPIFGTSFYFILKKEELLPNTLYSVFWSVGSICFLAMASLTWALLLSDFSFGSLLPKNDDIVRWKQYIDPEKPDGAKILLTQQLDSRLKAIVTNRKTLEKKAKRIQFSIALIGLLPISCFFTVVSTVLFERFCSEIVAMVSLAIIGTLIGLIIGLIVFIVTIRHSKSPLNTPHKYPTFVDNSTA